MPRLKSDLLGSTRAARFLGINRSTFDCWRKKEFLKPTVVEEGPKYLFSVADLQEFRNKIDYRSALADGLAIRASFLLEELRREFESLARWAEGTDDADWPRGRRPFGVRKG